MDQITPQIWITREQKHKQADINAAVLVKTDRGDGSKFALQKAVQKQRDQIMAAIRIQNLNTKQFLQKIKISFS